MGRGVAVVLAQTFVESWSGKADMTQLEAALQELCARARQVWPTVDIDGQTFVRFVAGRVSADTDPVPQLAALCAGDLYLACGCAEGSQRAAAAFGQHVAPAVAAAARRAGAPAGDDLMQELYQRLFLREPGRAPKIERYVGTGDLRTWVGVVATRMAIDAGRRDRTDQPLDEELLDQLLDSARSNEFEHLRREYRQHFKTAFTEAVTRLSPRDRNVLRYHFDGLTADQIGRMHKVHRVTVARWLSRIRFHLFEQTRSALRDSLGATKPDVASIIQMLDGEISLSIDRLLRWRGPGESPPSATKK